MNDTIRAARSNVDAGLAALRVVTGLIFVAHGAQKLFVYGLDGVTGAFASVNIPMAVVSAPAVTLLELVGGLALMAGLVTRATGAALAVVMLGAIFFVHLPAGFFLPDGVEFTLMLLAALVALVLAGPGAYSVDALVGRRRARA